MGTFFRFLKSLFRYIFTGHFQNVRFGEFARRIQICSTCPHISPTDYRCKICGCYMDKKCKWGTEHCALKKW